ncbi:DMT family transporter [Terriglobus roseus]|uniref:Transporter family-2 protein n=1 Tax=Terriglobus roseus TaxID=392734 RepID=A0A1H4PU53_9BACT|nr:DMT family transporter [Terriglobus roseus]SEC10841.1 transporter family-2 protein [Terriglobus roseus]
MQWFAIVFALVAGAANPFQSGSNAALKTQLGQPLWATVWVYGTGLLGVLLMQAILRQPLPSGAQVSTVSWWAWTGGLISIIATVIGLMLAQKLGSGVFTGVSITASVVVSILLDHFGMLGLKQHTASPMRLVGGALMVCGVWLVARF